MIEDNPFSQIFDKYGDHTKELYDEPVDENNILDEQLPECISGIEKPEHKMFRPMAEVMAKKHSGS